MDRSTNDIRPNALMEAERGVHEAIARIEQGFQDLGHTLKGIRDEQLYREVYSTWTAYVEDTFGTSTAVMSMFIKGHSKALHELDWHLGGGRKSRREEQAKHDRLYQRMRELSICPHCSSRRTRHPDYQYTPRALLCDACGYTWMATEAYLQAHEEYYRPWRVTEGKSP